MSYVYFMSYVTLFYSILYYFFFHFIKLIVNEDSMDTHIVWIIGSSLYVYSTSRFTHSIEWWGCERREGWGCFGDWEGSGGAYVRHCWQENQLQFLLCLSLGLKANILSLFVSIQKFPPVESIVISSGNINLKVK